MEQARRLGVRFVALGEVACPRALAACRDALPLLAVRGQLSVLSRPMVAQVELGAPQGGLFEDLAADHRPAEDALDGLHWLLAGQPAATVPPFGGKDRDLASTPVADPRTVVPPEGPVRPAREVLLDLLGATAPGIDDLAWHSALGVRVVQGELVELEMDGLVRRDASGVCVRV